MQHFCFKALGWQKLGKIGQNVKHGGMQSVAELCPPPPLCVASRCSGTPPGHLWGRGQKGRFLLQVGGCWGREEE